MVAYRARHLSDDLRGDPRGFGDLRRQERLHPLGQRFEADRIFLHELLVIQFLLNNHMKHRHRERRVGTGSNLSPHIGLRGGFRKPGVHDDKLRATAPGERHLVSAHAVCGAGLRNIAAPPEHALRICASVTIEIADGKLTARYHRGHHPGEVTHMRVTECVGSPERVGEPEREHHVRSAGARSHADRFGTEFVLALQQFLRRRIQRLVPAYALPLVLAPCARPLERMPQSVGMIQVIDRRQSLRAHEPPAHRVVAVTRYFHHRAVLHVHIHPAHPVTHAANGFQGFFVFHGYIPLRQPGNTESIATTENQFSLFYHRSEEPQMSAD